MTLSEGESSTVLYRLREMDRARVKEREREENQHPKSVFVQVYCRTSLTLEADRCHYNTLIFPKNPLGLKVRAIGKTFTALAIVLVWKGSGPFDTGKIGQVLKHISVSHCDKHRACGPLLPISS